MYLFGRVSAREAFPTHVYSRIYIFADRLKSLASHHFVVRASARYDRKPCCTIRRTFKSRDTLSNFVEPLLLRGYGGKRYKIKYFHSARSRQCR